MMPRYWSRNGWTPRHAAVAAALALAGMAATAPAWIDIFTIAAHDPESSHVFLVLLIAPWLAWIRRERLRCCRPRGQWIGPLLVGSGWMISAFGYYYGFQSLWHGGAVVAVIGCGLSVLGLDILRNFLPSFAVLIFLIPMPQSLRLALAQPLQSVLANMTWWSFDLAGVDVEQYGNLLTINGQTVEIAEACNGLRMVFTLVLVCYAVAFSAPLKWYARAMILGLSPLSALVCNFVRMIPTVWCFGHFSPEVAYQFHDIAGWVMLFAAFGLLVGFLRVLRWAMIPVTRYTLAYD